MTPQTLPPLLALTSDQAAKLAGLSMSQLRRWNAQGLFPPSLANEPGRPYGRLYSFRDAVGLRVLATLRRDHGLSLPELAKVAERLGALTDDEWSGFRFSIQERRAYFDHCDTGSPKPAVTHAGVRTCVAVADFLAAGEVAARKLRDRTPDEYGRIERHRNIMHNEPILAGTRIRTEAIWSFHEAGWSEAAILQQYPRLVPADIRAAIAFERQRRQRLAG